MEMELMEMEIETMEMEREALAVDVREAVPPSVRGRSLTATDSEDHEKYLQGRRSPVWRSSEVVQLNTMSSSSLG